MSNLEEKRYTGSKTFQKQLREIPRSNGRGRNPKLLTARNEAILIRYYYYSEIKRIRFDDAIAICATEFFLSSFTLLNILQKEDALFSEILTKKYQISDLRDLLPQFKF